MHFALQVTGEVEYNGTNLNTFVPEKTSAYISQYDLHVPEMTVRETLDFSARFQGVGTRAGTYNTFNYLSHVCLLTQLNQVSLFFLCKLEIMKEVIRREKEAGITPDPDIDTYMKVNTNHPFMYSFFFLSPCLCYRNAFFCNLYCVKEANNDGGDSATPTTSRVEGTF